MAARAQLQLERCRLKRLNVEFNDAWLATEATLPEDMSQYVVATDHTMYEATDSGPGEDQFLMVDLAIACRPADEEELTRFDLVDIEVLGIFRIAGETPEATVDQLKFLNAVAMLHGVARGQIMSATGNCVDGPFILPSVNYLSETDNEENSVATKNNREDALPEAPAETESDAEQT